MAATLACGLVGGGVQSPLLAADSATAKVDFNSQIRSILSDNCFACHGQDEDARAAGLRLDIRSDAIDFGAIVPGNPSDSMLLERVLSEDADIRMPPPDTGKQLSKDQIEQLRRWIAEDAPYQQHWAFGKVEPVELPQLNSELQSLVNNPIDLFVIQRLQEVGLSLSEQANRETLIRRLYQDLLGLLPPIKDIDAFVNDTEEHAYERLVDRLLENPHYGERWGRHWLDQARYADSNGYSIDGDRTMWPYRDWVINALNQDMPFDQFTVEQLAGDLLPKPTKAQQVATAFHRNTMINQEGGVKADQYRHEAIIDRVNTTGAVWLGLTFGCAQCHTHKYDPITHDDYYRFYAFFNGTSDANNVGATVEVGEGEMFGWSDSQRQSLDELKRLQAELKQVEERAKAVVAGFDPKQWSWASPALASHFTGSKAPLERLSDGSLIAGDDVSANDHYLVELTDIASPITAVRLRVLPDSRLPSNGPGKAGNGNFVLTDVSLIVDDKPVRFVQAWADHSQSDYEISKAIDGDSQTGWAINVNGKQRKQGKSMNAEHEAIFVLEEPLSTAGKPLTLMLRHDRNPDYQVGRFAVDVSHSQRPSPAEATDWVAKRQQLRQRVTELESQLPNRGNTVRQMIMAEKSSTPDTFRLVRGDFLSPAHDEGPLSPAIPQALTDKNAVPKFQSRLDLARWLVSEENPLTARVFLNRVWGRYFGNGLVQTENDFGFQGTPPTHPLLLDWLADDFMQNGWSMRSLHRRIVLSATYRQRSHATAEKLAIDPGNRYLSRQSRFRVEGEIVRDLALSASGKLTPKLGGPSVYPPQPAGVFDFTQQKKRWPTEQGPDRFRRTMYTYFYRSAPYPLLTTFDAPDFSTTCTSRVRSNTPLQSLAVANDPMFLELAQTLAESVLEEQDASFESRLESMFRRCLSRRPSEQEASVLRDYVQRQIETFAGSKEKCVAFVGSDSSDLAAYTCLARVLINTDEFITRN